MRKFQLLLVALLGLSSIAATDCKYFNEVRVPAADSIRPTIRNATWTTDGYQKIGTNGYAFAHGLDLASDGVYALGAGTDSGGTAEVRMNWQATVVCCSRVRVFKPCPYNLVVEFPVSGQEADSQRGGVGTAVSNGIYVSKHVRPDDFRSMCPYNQLEAIEFEWTTTAEDFHGNTRSAGGARIEWSRW